MSRHFGGIQPGRQSDRTRTVLLASMFFIVLFSILAFFLLSTADPKGETTKTVVVETEAEIKMVEVLVPLRDVLPGIPLEAQMFRRESRPQVGVSNRTVRTFEEVRGHYARSLIVAGQPLHRDYITSVKPTNALTASIPKGFRAVTIRVDARTSVEGFVRPGAKVDVVWASRISGQPGVTVIVQNAKVLSAERQTATEQKSGVPVPSTVTLLVTSKDAQKIQLASTTGKLSLSLRGDADEVSDGQSRPITVNDLLGRRQVDGAVNANVEGSVTIGGEKWLMVDGKLVPSSKLKRN
ncbi:Flp pilus assembly protein CpaB [Oligoflexia bacterium]|nr:Flp pilus assembly protein CpaB [Oligoflexia bacterium]